MMAGKGNVKVCRSRSVAVVSKMPKRTWQVNYGCISKESCVSILREVRGESPEINIPPIGTTDKIAAVL
jgi:hypothetical protein